MKEKAYSLARNFSIKAKLTLGFGILVSLMVILTLLGVQNVNVIDQTLTEITDINSVKQRYAINYRGSVHDRAIAIRDVGMARSDSEMNGFINEIRQLETFYKDSEVKMKQMLSDGAPFTAQEKEILKRIDQIQASTLPLVESIINQKKSGSEVDSVLLEKARPAFTQWLGVINEFIDYQEAANQKATPEARSVAGGFQTQMLTLTAFAIGVSALVAFLLVRSLTNSLGGEPAEAQLVIGEMSQGNLAANVRSDKKGSILHSLAVMRDKLKGIAQEINTSATSLTQGVAEVSDASSVALKASEEQGRLTSDVVSQLESIAHSIERVASIAQETEANSKETSAHSMEGKSIAMKASEEMSRIAQTVLSTVEQIKVLQEKTSQIGGIVNVINGISEQTNLLALNAAIEAARAGESGRGFAVVADEVRSLAQRTSESTTQIERVISEVQRETMATVSMMETAQPQVESAKDKVASTTQLLQSIEGRASDSLAKVREVVMATNIQVEMVSGISGSVNRIAEMSERTIGSMQHNDYAAKSLGELAGGLKKVVGFFRV